MSLRSESRRLIARVKCLQLTLALELHETKRQKEKITMAHDLYVECACVLVNQTGLSQVGGAPKLK